MPRQIAKAFVFSTGVMLALFAFPAFSDPPLHQDTAVPLQQGTSTFSQTCCGLSVDSPSSPAQSIDGIFSDVFGATLNGWAPLRDEGGHVSYAETAVWETSFDIGPGTIRFTMSFFHANPGHFLGRFRFSVTTDDRDTFADGYAIDGDVDANWTVLRPRRIGGPAGMTFMTLPDDSILAGGVVPGMGVYIVEYKTRISGITGVRLEALEDPSLPANDGPGFFPNGNFVLTELVMHAID